MAHETGSATGPNDLLQKLRIFAVAQGWTVNRNTTAVTGRELCLSKGSQYVNFRSYENESGLIINDTGLTNKYGIALNGSDGYDGGDPWDRQPGYTRSPFFTNPAMHAVMMLPVVFGPFPTYNFYAEENYVYVEVEVAATLYQRFGWGKLDTFAAAPAGDGRFFYATGWHANMGPFIGGGHWLASNPDDSNYAEEMVPFRAADYVANSPLAGSYLRAAFDSFDGWCQSTREPVYSYTGQACQGGGCHDKILRDCAPAPRNGVGVLLPNIVSVNRASEFLSPVGVVPGMRYMDMTPYQPGEEFSLGTDTWQVFPWYQKGGITLNRGIAYKKVT